MENDYNKEELLNDVFGDAALPAFRAAVLEKTLLAVHRRNRRSQRNRRLLAMGCVVITLLFVLRFRPAPKTPAPSAVNPLIVLSEPLRPGMIVLSRDGTVGLV